MGEEGADEGVVGADGIGGVFDRFSVGFRIEALVEVGSAVEQVGLDYAWRWACVTVTGKLGYQVDHYVDPFTDLRFYTCRNFTIGGLYLGPRPELLSTPVPREPLIHSGWCRCGRAKRRRQLD